MDYVTCQFIIKLVGSCSTSHVVLPVIMVTTVTALTESVNNVHTKCMSVFPPVCWVCCTSSPSPPGLPSQPTLLPHQWVWSPLLHHWRYSWDRSGSSSGDTVCSACRWESWVEVCVLTRKINERYWLPSGFIHYSVPTHTNALYMRVPTHTGRHIVQCD